MQAAAVVIHRMLWCKEGAIPALSCMQAAVMIHRMLVEEGCASLPCKLAAVVIHRMLWCKEGCAIPALSCMQAAVMIHRMLWWKKVCYPALPCKLLLL
jgi:hypothetical protein